MIIIIIMIIIITITVIIIINIIIIIYTAQNSTQLSIVLSTNVRLYLNEKVFSDFLKDLAVGLIMT